MENNKTESKAAENKTAGGTAGKHMQRPKMPIELRAKQFMPFAAVTGLEKALREKEKEIEQRIE